MILGLPYFCAIDMWSFGCILAELYTGYPLFPGENEVEQLACQMEVLGPPPPDLIGDCSRRKQFFDADGTPRIVANSKGRKRRPSSKDLMSCLRCTDVAFISFLEGCLQWDAKQRFTPEAAMAHEWILELATPPQQPQQPSAAHAGGGGERGIPPRGSTMLTGPTATDGRPTSSRGRQRVGGGGGGSLSARGPSFSSPPPQRRGSLPHTTDTRDRPSASMLLAGLIQTSSPLPTRSKLPIAVAVRGAPPAAHRHICTSRRPLAAQRPRQLPSGHASCPAATPAAQRPAWIGMRRLRLPTA